MDQCRLGRLLWGLAGKVGRSLRAADYLIKKDEEREIARAERERLREERKVEQELAAARERLEKERTHLATVIEKLKASGSSDPDLEQQLVNVDNAIVQNDYRAANIRAGYVYVISNRGALGEHVVKIGLTRWLEPLDRINRLLPERELLAARF